MKEFLDTEKFFWLGGRVCLDFVNTKVAMGGAVVDLLESLPDLAAWAAKAKLVETPEAETLARAVNDEKEAQESLEQIREFRENLRAAIFSFERGERISPVVIEELNRRLAAVRGRAEIVETDDTIYEKHFRARYLSPLDLLAPVAESAADLICYANSERVKKCENPACVLHFYDQTKSRTRRWCSMQVCGNRAKAAAFYERGKQKNAAKKG